jgi:hypothetical protein
MDEPSRLMKGAKIFKAGLLMEFGSLRIFACEKTACEINSKQTITLSRFIRFLFSPG